MAIYSARRIGTDGDGDTGGTDIPTEPNGKAKILKKSGFNSYGQINYVHGGEFDVYIANLYSEEKLSSIRTDTSASKSTIDETIYEAEVQISPASKIEAGDGMVIRSNGVVRKYRAVKVNDVYGTTGISHLLVKLSRL